MKWLAFAIWLLICSVILYLMSEGANDFGPTDTNVEAMEEAYTNGHDNGYNAGYVDGRSYCALRS